MHPFYDRNARAFNILFASNTRYKCMILARKDYKNSRVTIIEIFQKNGKIKKISGYQAFSGDFKHV